MSPIHKKGDERTQNPDEAITQIHTLNVVRMRDRRVGFAGEDIDWFIISSISGYSDSPGMLKMEAAEKTTTIITFL